MKHLRLTLLTSLCLLAGVVSAHNLKPVTTVEGIREYRLPNGLQVLLVPDDSKPTTTVNVTYRVGSKNENYGETGMAHLLEHLLFKGSPQTPDPWGEFTKRGLQANGSTWFDRTNYFAAFAANDDNLKWYINWQADAMVHSYIAKRHLDTEMTVVRNEMERGENDPSNVTMQRILATMYQWHNYGKDTIGARSDVENVDINHLQAFYRTYYQPDNATLIVSGKFDPEKVLTWVEQSFSKIPKPKRSLPKTYTIDPVQDGERLVTVRRAGGAPQAYAGYHVPAGPHPDYAAIELLNIILTEAPSGRLHKRLVEEKKIAASVSNMALATAEPGFDIVFADLAPGASLDDLTRELVSVSEGFAAQPVTAEELARAKTRWLNRWNKLFTSPEQIGVTLSESIAQGDWRMFFLLRDRIQALTVADVQRVAAQRFLPANRTAAQYIPTEKPVRAPAPEFVDVAGEMKSFKPQAGAAAVQAFDASPAHIDAVTQISSLPNGLKLALLPKPTRGEAVTGTISLRLGDAKALFGQQTAASLTAALLDMGTTDLTRQALHDALDAAQVTVSLSARGTDRISLNFTTRKPHTARALELIGAMLRTPRLDAAGLEEVRAQALTALQARRDDPESLADEAVTQALNDYPKGDVRYNATMAEQEAELKATTLDAVKNFHSRFYGADAAQLSLVGDFDPALVKATALKVFGDWKAQSPSVHVPRKAPVKPGKVQTIATPDKQNANFLAVMPLALNDDHPDRAALTLVNHILGGGGNSRLWVRIREKEGLSYGVGTGLNFSVLDTASSWYAYAIFAPQNRSKVEAALRDEVARALKEGFSAKELAEAKQALLNDRRLARAQDNRLASANAQNLQHDRKWARVKVFEDELTAQTLDQVNAALRKHFKLDNFQMVFAGDFKP